MQKGQQCKSHVTAPPLPHSTCPGMGVGGLKSSFQNARLRKTASLHLFPCCGKATLTGFDPKQGQLQNEILQPGRTRRPSLATLPQHIRLQLCGNMPRLGAAARTLLALLEEALCCGPKSFLKVHTESQLLPILHFLFGEISGSLEPE